VDSAAANLRWHGFPDADGLHAAARQRIVDAATQAIERSGKFSIVLSGGETPRAVYKLLSKVDTDWSRWRIYFGDERCVPADDPRRNSKMVFDTWLSQVVIRPSNLHVMRAELGADVAVREYAQVLADVDDFDLVLLGIGEDGHTASLFPGHEWGIGDAAPDVLAVFDAPKPPPLRVSLTASRLRRAREVLFLIVGESKREAVGRWLADEDIPANAIRPRAGVDVFLEACLLP
jgi:6-phosphogluconolactonase